MYRHPSLSTMYREISIATMYRHLSLSNIYHDPSLATMYCAHCSLIHDRFTKNVTKKCGWVIVGFFSYFTNLLRAKSDLLGLSSYIDFSISHVNFHLRNLAIFGFFAFIWTHLRPLARKKYSKYGFRGRISRWIRSHCQKNS